MSFGTVLYELLSGRRPFEAKSSAEVISAILTTEPPPISCSSLGHCGSGEEELIRKCLEKDAALRYQTMGDLIPDLQQIRREYETGQVTPRSGTATVKPKAITDDKGGRFRVSRLGLVLTLLPLVLAGAGVWFFSFRSLKRTPAAAVMSTNPVAYDAYRRGEVNVGSENPDNNNAAISCG